MASKDGRVPGFLHEDESKENDTLSERSASSPAPSFPPPHQWLEPETPSSLNPPDDSPEVWARKLLMTVNNPKEFNHKATLNIAPPPPRSPTSTLMDSPPSTSRPSRPSLLSSLSPPRRRLGSDKSKKNKRPKSKTSTTTNSSSGTKHARSSSSAATMDTRTFESAWQKRVRRDKERRFLKSNNRVMYSWETAGSEALSECLQRQVAPHYASMTPLQTLQLVHSLRLQTIVAPKASPLHRVIQNSGYQNEEIYGLDEDSDKEEEDLSQKKEERLQEDGNNKSIHEVEMADTTPPRDDDKANTPQENDTPPPVPPLHFKTLARLYETMCQQDADDGSYIRHELQHVSPRECVEKMRDLESTATVLSLREEEVMDQARELGLINNSEIYARMGYWTPLERYNSQSLVETKRVQEEIQDDEKETLEQKEGGSSKETSVQEEEEAKS